MSLSTDDLVVDTFRGTNAFTTALYPSPCPYSRNTSGQAHVGMLCRRPRAGFWSVEVVNSTPSRPNPRKNRPKNHSRGLTEHGPAYEDSGRASTCRGVQRQRSRIAISRQARTGRREGSCSAFQPRSWAYFSAHHHPGGSQCPACGTFSLSARPDRLPHHAVGKSLEIAPAPRARPPAAAAQAGQAGCRRAPSHSHRHRK